MDIFSNLASSNQKNKMFSVGNFSLRLTVIRRQMTTIINVYGNDMSNIVTSFHRNCECLSDVH